MGGHGAYLRGLGCVGRPGELFSETNDNSVAILLSYGMARQRLPRGVPRATVCYNGGCTLEGVHTNVSDASAAGTVRPRGADGHRSGGGRLRGALPQVRDGRSGAGELRRSAEGAVGVGAA